MPPRCRRRRDTGSRRRRRSAGEVAVGGPDEPQRSAQPRRRRMHRRVTKHGWWRDNRDWRCTRHPAVVARTVGLEGAIYPSGTIADTVRPEEGVLPEAAATLCNFRDTILIVLSFGSSTT
jgi:hypothetical protein